MYTVGTVFLRPWCSMQDIITDLHHTSFPIPATAASNHWHQTWYFINFVQSSYHQINQAMQMTGSSKYANTHNKLYIFLASTILYSNWTKAGHCKPTSNKDPILTPYCLLHNAILKELQIQHNTINTIQLHIHIYTLLFKNNLTVNPAEQAISNYKQMLGESQTFVPSFKWKKKAPKHGQNTYSIHLKASMT